MYALRYAAGTHTGMRRVSNEDSFQADGRFFAVADGIGGQAYGEVASSIAIDALAEIDIVAEEPLTTLANTAHEISAKLTRIAENDSGMRGMGTTLTALLWDQNRFAVCHIGDSRCYRLRDGELTLITKDHSLVQSLVDAGKIEAEQAARHPARSMLTKAFQAAGSDMPDFFFTQVAVGDRYLLCSDGLSDVLPATDIKDHLAKSKQIDAIVDDLIAAANANGGPDNITCVLVDVVAEPAHSGH